jgi:hypothetical protein
MAENVDFVASMVVGVSVKLKEGALKVQLVAETSIYTSISIFL